MKINFILPYPARKPGGGHKIIYQYAERLAARGHQVTLLHPLKLEYFHYGKPLFVRWLGHHLFRSAEVPWYDFKSKVDSRLIPSISPMTVPDADITVATYWATALPTTRLPPEKGVGFYFIQHYEIWDGYLEKVHASYSLPLKKIVIAKWLRDKIEDLGSPVTGYLPNAIDSKQFYLTTPIARRVPQSILMLYSEVAFKGSKEAVRLLEKLKQTRPDLQCHLFGVAPRPPHLPKWIDYTCNPPLDRLRDLYNQSAIYFCSSYGEGWPLPPAEAMSCGCALVGYNIGGLREYGIQGETACLAPLKDEVQILQYLSTLIENPAQRIRIAEQGYQYLTDQFQWEHSVSKMELLFEAENSNTQ